MRPPNQFSAPSRLREHSRAHLHVDLIAGLPDDPQRRAYARAMALPEDISSPVDWLEAELEDIIDELVRRFEPGGDRPLD